VRVIELAACCMCTLLCVGILAVEGSNDRMDKLVESGKHPIDIILLFAAAEVHLSTNLNP